MIEWTEAPVFGRCPAGVTPVLRPSAYALIADADGRVAIVFTPEGVYLPGGGIEAGETPEQAVRREAVEECGFLVAPGGWTRRAIQLAFSVAEGVFFEKRCTFMDGTVTGASGSDVEEAHELRWVEPVAAVALLTHESHGWAVEEWSRERAAV